ncbi:MAG: TetR/AcrR family transcriptional regulator [Oscillospiraceae bacterium]|nr:TetR/AcrR family transcriptional regulator [Oscillospiraceae bacterium]
MPPRSRIDREMIRDAAFTLVREQGIDALNARTVASKLGCSTQPVMYHYATMAELRQEVYAMADRMHTAYLMDMGPETQEPFLELGLRYIRFAAEEKHLFRFLFQSDGLGGAGLGAMMDSPELAPVFGVMAQSGVPPEVGKQIFLGSFLTAHGMASLLANNAMTYDETLCVGTLSMMLEGLLSGMEDVK